MLVNSLPAITYSPRSEMVVLIILKVGRFTLLHGTFSDLCHSARSWKVQKTYINLIY